LLWCAFLLLCVCEFFCVILPFSLIFLHLQLFFLLVFFFFQNCPGFPFDWKGPFPLSSRARAKGLPFADCASPVPLQTAIHLGLWPALFPIGLGPLLQFPSVSLSFCMIVNIPFSLGNTLFSFLRVPRYEQGSVFFDDETAPLSPLAQPPNVFPFKTGDHFSPFFSCWERSGFFFLPSFFLSPSPFFCCFCADEFPPPFRQKNPFPFCSPFFGPFPPFLVFPSLGSFLHSYQVTTPRLFIISLFFDRRSYSPKAGSFFFFRPLLFFLSSHPTKGPL